MSDQDTRVSTPGHAAGDGAARRRRSAPRSSFIEPEILKIDPATVDAFVAQRAAAEGLHASTSTTSSGARAHTLSDARGEAARRRRRSLAGSAVRHLRHPRRTPTSRTRRVTLSDGKTRQARSARRSACTARVPNRDDREKVMSAFFGALGAFRGTFGTTMNGEVQKRRVLREGAQVQRSRSRRRSTAPNIPTSVYTRLVDGVNQEPADVPPLPEAAQADDGRRRAALLRSLRAAGRVGRPRPTRPRRRRSTCWRRSRRSAPTTRPRVDARVQRALDRLLPERRASASGAYSNGGAYDVHPYMLINYNGKYNDMSTLAHELGHTMQSYCSNKTQPYPTGRTTRSSSPRSRRRSTRRCSSTTC